ncbi:MAG TPA: hypothetical protein VEB20_11550, partial [Azospirillaceae bacterium]|nr:hypothetical protein [Azospirillaceae bacterium]
QMGQGWRVESVADFYGNGSDDFLFFNTQSRAMLFWDSTQGNSGFRDFITLSEGWSFVESGDVSGDGKADVILRNDASGAAIYWDGGKFVDLGGTLAGVTVVGVGDVG